METYSLIFVILGAISLLIKYKFLGMIYALVFLLPFGFEVFNISGVIVKSNDILAIVYILLWMILLISKKIKKRDINVLKSTLIFMFIVSISFLINAFRFNYINNFIDYIRFLLAVLSGIAVSTSIKTSENIIRLFKIWAIASIISSIISILTFFLNGHGFYTFINLNNLNVIEFYEIKFANSIFFEDPNNLATYLVISIFITIGLILSKRIDSKIKYIVIIVQVIGLILTLSRSAYIATFFSLIIYMFLFQKRSYTWWFFIILAFTFVLYISINSFYLFNSDVSVMSRFGLWQVGINMTLSNLLIGVGIGNSSTYFHEYINSSLLIYNPHFHNLFLTISSEFGVIGICSFISIFIKSIFRLKKYGDKLYIFLVLGLIAYLIQSLGVEYFASRHFWIFVSLLNQYRAFLNKGENYNELSFSINTRL